jgi:hypothetical protein
MVQPSHGARSHFAFLGKNIRRNQQRSGYTKSLDYIKLGATKCRQHRRFAELLNLKLKERTVACVPAGSQRSFSSPLLHINHHYPYPSVICSQSFLVYACSRPHPIITIPAGSAVSLKKLFQKRSLMKIKITHVNTREDFVTTTFCKVCAFETAATSMSLLK